MVYTTREDFLTRAAARLAPANAVLERYRRTDFDLTPGSPSKPDPPYRRAAVLMGLIDRGEEPFVLLTLRPETMRRHAGQIAFPGGRLDPKDASPLAAALREANEEVGVDPARVELLGQGDPYLTSTGYLVSPFVGRLPSDFIPSADPHEVADVFETPLAFLMNPANHQRHERSYQGHLRAYYAMPHNGRYIWGATAGMIRAIYDRIYGEPAGPTPEGEKNMTRRIFMELVLFLLPFAVFLIYRAASKELKIADRWPLTLLVVCGAAFAVIALIAEPLLAPSEKGKCYLAARYEHGKTLPAQSVDCAAASAPDAKAPPPTPPPVAPRNSAPPRPSTLRPPKSPPPRPPEGPPEIVRPAPPSR